MPEITVWPVSSSLRTWKVGSSSPRRWSATDSFSWSTFVFGSIERCTTGSGKFMRSRITGASGAESVSPVEVCLRPTPAAMSPAYTSSTSSRVFACIIRMRPTRSVRPVTELSTRPPALSLPEYTRK